MQKHELKRNIKNKKKIKVGRGGKRGKTSGRGHKGQNARAGTSKRPEMRDVIKKLPKLRGRGVNSNKSIKNKPFAVTLDVLEKSFVDNEKVNPKTLFDRGLIRKISGKYPVCKILSTGDLKKKLIISNCEISVTAKEKVEKAGGKVILK